jgi:cardiolipin synthase
MSVIKPLSGLALSRWRRTAGRLLRLGGESDGNELVLFSDGDRAFETILAAIASATRRVWVETYIFEPDALGKRILAALTAAAQRGCEVRLLVDDLGSSSLRVAHTVDLVKAGGHVCRFNPARVSWLFPQLKSTLLQALPLSLRDHRKVIVVDDEHGFIGGMNISEDYAGPTMGNGRFKDTHLLVSGPAAADLGAIFASSWRHTTHERLSVPPPMPPSAHGSHVQILGSDRFLGRRRIQRALAVAINRAQQRIYLTTPYFIPPPRVLSALRRAARRGVDVRVLTAGVSDVPLAASAARHLYGTLLESGVQIYELQGAVLHEKSAVIDGFYAHVGSFNLDHWSYDRNLEVVAMSLDPGVGADLDTAFRKNLEHSREVRLDTWRRRGLFSRLWGHLAYRLARL